MLISHEYRFIYTKTHKTAGTSTEAYFERFCMPEGTWSPSQARELTVSDRGIVGYRGPNPRRFPYYAHMPAELLREQLGAERWNSYFKFCNIRNPYDKAISAFFSIHNERNEGLKGSTFEEIHQKFETWVREEYQPTDRKAYLINGQFVMDGVVRYEHLRDDLEQVCQRLGIPWQPDLLPRYQADIRPPEFSVERMVTKTSAARIEELYAAEFQLFEYPRLEVE